MVFPQFGQQELLEAAHPSLTRKIFHQVSIQMRKTEVNINSRVTRVCTSHKVMEVMAGVRFKTALH